ncbi:hypothetical protein [Raineyella sp. W15-4]|nr:hypothetical protein [Raineyella sp. W15-4]WOQ18723.1 hypothetical protein R0145_08670 [Raineyella sp. W15-4]
MAEPDGLRPSRTRAVLVSLLLGLTTLAGAFVIYVLLVAVGR